MLLNVLCHKVSNLLYTPVQLVLLVGHQCVDLLQNFIELVDFADRHFRVAREKVHLLGLKLLQLLPAQLELGTELHKPTK